MSDGRDAIEKLQERLYSKTAQTGVRPRSVLRGPSIDKPEGWSEELEKQNDQPPVPPQKPRSHNGLVPFFIASLIFFIGAAGYATYSFFYGGNTVSSANIDMSVLGPSMSDGGKEASFDITIGNRNASALELVDLLVEYPDGTRSPQDTKIALPSERISIGTIDSGTRTKQTVRAVLFGEAGSIEHVKATLEYRIAGSNAIFTKEAGLDVMIGASPVAITVNGPDETVAGQPATFTIRVRSNAQGPIKNLALEAQYPFGFSITNANPETSVGDSLWRLGDLSPGEEKVVTIEGTIDGQDNEERVFRFLAGSEEDQTAAHVSVPYLIVPHDVAIKRPFITATLVVNGDSGQTVVINPGQDVGGTINWQNNLDTEVQDLSVSMKITGAAFDNASVRADRGFFNSSNSTIIWNSANDQNLSSIPPGKTGSVSFSFKTKGASGPGALVNPTITLAVSVGGRRVQAGNVPEDVTSAFTRTLKFGSALTVSSGTRHFSGPIANSGPMPPKVGAETTYSVVWTVKNPSNTISNTKVTATLPPYVRYIGSVSPSNERVSYDARSGLVTWSLGDVKAGAGLSAPAREVTFQVGITPSLTQRDNTPALTGALSVSGDDRFTGARLQASGNGTTILPSYAEPEFVTGMEKVSN